MDGAFIDPENIVYDNCQSPIYEDSCIRCRNVESIQKRNQRKSAVLNRLISLPTVWKSIPYSIYFFSCNLDHVIHNDPNLDNKLKNEKAVQFAMKFKNDPQDFISYFNNSNFSIIDDYKNSWSFIKMDNNSLKKYTNFGLIFTKNAKNKTLISLNNNDK